jgi:hypothetical protein
METEAAPIRSWIGGPLRPDKSMYELWAYICDRCRQSARTGVCRVKGEWLCHSCEHGHIRISRPTPSDAQIQARQRFGAKHRSQAGYIAGNAHLEG